MTTAADFVPAILADPDDDAPRLILADWLEETGTDPARAEFIRVQCALAGVEARLGTPLETFRDRGDADALRRREGELLKRVCTGPCPGFMTMQDMPVMRRGFVERVTMPAAAWLEHAGALLAAQPVRHVTLTTVPRSGEQSGLPFGEWQGLTRREYHAVVAKRLGARWPGVSFRLPDVDELDRRDRPPRMTNTRRA